MDRYFDLFREIISLRGLSVHTLKNYCTYIKWLQKERHLSDRTINLVLSHLRFSTIYVLPQSRALSADRTCGRGGRGDLSVLKTVMNQNEIWKPLLCKENCIF